MSQPTVADVTKQARAWLNDTNAAKYTDQVLLPYVQGAVDELEHALQENGAETLGTASAVLTVPANTKAIAYAATTPVLPADLVEPSELWEGTSGQPTSTFNPVDPVMALPIRVQTGSLDEYLWEEEKIKFVGATQARDILINYKKGFARLTDPVTPTQVIAYNQGLAFLAFKTAALAAELIAQNHTRAEVLHQQAEVALGRTLNIRARDQQGMPVRRRGWVRPSRKGGLQSIYRTR